MSAIAQTELVKKTEESVREYMSQYDASHDHAHIERVVNIATHLYQVESTAHPEIPYDELTVRLAALVHDVGDHKYQKPGQTDEEAKVAGKVMLIANGANLSLAQTVQVIAHGVSYTGETRDPEAVRSLIKQYPELAIVQDADRLDALGAVGIARVFTYNGAHPTVKDVEKGTEKGTMESAIVHVNDKLCKLAGMMKTDEGRRMAHERWEKIRLFKAWWEEEHSLNGEGRKKTNWEGGSYK